MCISQNRPIAGVTHCIILARSSTSPGTVRQTTIQRTISVQKHPRQLLKKDDQNSETVACPEKEKKWGFLYIYFILSPHKKTPLMPEKHKRRLAAVPLSFITQNSSLPDALSRLLTTKTPTKCFGSLQGSKFVTLSVHSDMQFM